MQSKVFWVNKKKIQYKNSDLNTDTCAICRHPLNDFCLTCQANNKPTIDKTIEKIDKTIEKIEKMKTVRHASKQTWMVMLMMQRRPGCLFSLLDRAVMAKIISFIDHSFLLSCPAAFLKCLHTYHMHCFLLWIAKRSVCPLCNNSDVEFSESPISTSIVLNRVYQSEHPFISELDKKDHLFEASTFLYQELKHTFDGISGDHLFQRYQGRFFLTLRRIAPLEERRITFFQSALNYLISREYIFLEEPTNIYYHIP